MMRHLWLTLLLAAASASGAAGDDRLGPPALPSTQPAAPAAVSDRWAKEIAAFVAQDAATPEALAAVLRRVRGDAAALAAMRVALLARARPDAADALAAVVIACASDAAGRR